MFKKRNSEILPILDSGTGVARRAILPTLAVSGLFDGVFATSPKHPPFQTKGFKTLLTATPTANVNVLAKTTQVLTEELTRVAHYHEYQFQASTKTGSELDDPGLENPPETRKTKLKQMSSLAFIVKRRPTAKSVKKDQRQESLTPADFNKPNATDLEKDREDTIRVPKGQTHLLVFRTGSESCQAVIFGQFNRHHRQPHRLPVQISDHR